MQPKVCGELYATEIPVVLWNAWGTATKLGRKDRVHWGPKCSSPLLSLKLTLWATADCSERAPLVKQIQKKSKVVNMNNIFSTYSQGENRVTSSILAVIRSLSLDRIERILGALLEQSELKFVRFDNQPSKGCVGVPDAIIQSSFRLPVETKTERDGLNRPQLERHLASLSEAKEQSTWLLILTPDDDRPALVEDLGDERVVWASFAHLCQAIDELLDDNKEVVSEREAFLLRELQSMLEAEGLLADANDVVIVAARLAWKTYQDRYVYICQPNRSFRNVKRIGFYSRGNIYSLVPMILEKHDDVIFERSVHEGPLGELVNQVLDSDDSRSGQRYMVFFLSAPTSDETLDLGRNIPNDKKSKTGKNTAFTMSQRYVSSEALVAAEKTSDLD